MRSDCLSLVYQGFGMSICVTQYQGADFVHEKCFYKGIKKCDDSRVHDSIAGLFSRQIGISWVCKVRGCFLSTASRLEIIYGWT